MYIQTRLSKRGNYTVYSLTNGLKLENKPGENNHGPSVAVKKVSGVSEMNNVKWLFALNQLSRRQNNRVRKSTRSCC